MIPRSLLGALLGLVFSLGLAMLVVGVAGTPKRTVSTRNVSTELLRRVIAAGFAFTVATAITGWFSLGIMLGVAVYFFPSFIANRRKIARDRERLRALAQWVELIRDSLKSATGIEEAVISSSDLVARTAIAPEVRRLRVATETRGLKEGLTEFSESIADPVADQVCWALLVASERPSASVTEVLSKAAASARESVARREKVEAMRARSYLVVNATVAVTVGLGTMLLATQSSFREWYSTFFGQVFLVIGISAQLALYAVMIRMARPAKTHRMPITSLDGISSLSSGLSGGSI